jgi:hypothetical protein
MNTPAIIILAVAASMIVVAERDQIIEEWTAIYPVNPVHKTSLQFCAMEDRQFNRFSAESRQQCYAKWVPVLETRALAPRLLRTSDKGL